MVWGTYHHKIGDFTKLLKLVRKLNARLSERGGCNPYLGNAKNGFRTSSGVLPYRTPYCAISKKGGIQEEKSAIDCLRGPSKVCPKDKLLHLLPLFS